MDVTVLEPGRGAAENEIHVARDEAVGKVVPATISQNGILPAQEPQLRNTTRSPSTRMASAWPTGPAEFSNVTFSAVKSSASITVEAVRNVPMGFPSAQGEHRG